MIDDCLIHCSIFAVMDQILPVLELFDHVNGRQSDFGQYGLGWVLFLEEHGLGWVKLSLLLDGLGWVGLKCFYPFQSLKELMATHFNI